MRPPLVCALLALLALAAGCGGEEVVEPAPPGAAGTESPGNPVTVEQAMDAGGTQLVRGSLLARDGDVRLCTVLMESFPPQCGDPSLRVEGLDLDTLEGITAAEGVTWSERELFLRGEVDGDVLRVGETR